MTACSEQEDPQAAPLAWGLSQPLDRLVGMNEQLRFQTGPATMGQRSRSAMSARRLDTRTLKIGRRGVAEARLILAAHRRIDHDPTPLIQVVEAA